MASFRELQRIAARADRAMATLTAAQRREINTRLTLTLRVILREAQGLYARALRELDEIGEVASGTSYRLARARLLLDQLDGTLQAAARDTQPLNGLLQNARQAAEIAREIANQAIDRYGIQSLTISTPLDHRQLVSLVENAAIRLHRHTLDNIERIKDAVSTGLVRGSGWPRVSRDIREATGLLRSRADMIAVTELHNAAADSRAMTYLERGVEYVIRLVTIDDRTCPVCGARSGEITRLADTREVLHPRCRCILNPWYPQWVEDGVFDPAEVEAEAAAILRELEEQGLKPRYGRAPFEPEDYERRVVWRPGMPLSALPGYSPP